MTLLEPLNLDDVRIDPSWALRVPAAFALRKFVLPLSSLDGVIQVACLNVDDPPTMQAVERYVEHPLRPVLVERDSLRRALARIFGAVSMPGSAAGTPMRLRVRDGRPTDTDEGSVALCDELMQAALMRGASDIHIDPSERHVGVRFRVDGDLETYRDFPSDLHHGLISRFKVLGEMDIAEKRAPQDGRFTVSVGASGQRVDVRVASMPTRHGERMTLRLLSLDTSGITLERLGMSPHDLELFEQAVARPYGLVLLTGPTGSGKSTTLHAALKHRLKTLGGNIITVEDPVEYDIPGVAQVEVDSVDKVSFHKALRSVLRHDPDVIMIGEIRDAETADVALKSALTGHLVFSTLHTNNAAGVVTRLIDMGLQRYLVAATLRLAVAQRLVRRLCSRCRVARELTEAEAGALQHPELAGSTVYEPQGCLHCAGRGISGRVGLFELLPMDERLSAAIARGASEVELVESVRQSGLRMLHDDGVEKALAGETTIQDVLSAVAVW